MPVCPIEKPATQRRQPPCSPSALTTLLVIGMTFENILTEDERLNSQRADLSAAKLQLEGRGRKQCKSKLSEYVICLLATVSPLALAFQGERGNNQAALIQCEGWKRKKKEKRKRQSRGRRRGGSFSQSPPSWRLSHRSNTCPHIGGSASRCYPGTASLRPCDGIPSEFFSFFFLVPPCLWRSAWCHPESLPPSAHNVC